MLRSLRHWTRSWRSSRRSIGWTDATSKSYVFPSSYSLPCVCSFWRWSWLLPARSSRRPRLGSQRPARLQPPRARPTTATSQFGRRYFDGSYLKEKRVCPASDTRHLSLFDAPHGPASRLHLPPPPPASTSRLHKSTSTSASATVFRVAPQCPRPLRRRRRIGKRDARKTNFMPSK